MKTIQHTVYECEKCKQCYDRKKDAKRCESKLVSESKGVKTGDKVVVTSGDGKGQTATVKSIFIIKRDWGHHHWELYWHTVGITADLDDSWGTRMLTFDSYTLP